VVISRGDLWWVDLGAPVGSRPAKRRPVLVIQADDYNASQIATVLVAVVTSNTALAGLPGNTFLPAGATGLPRDTVVNVTQLLTINRSELAEPAGLVAGDLLRQVDAGLRLVLGL
jgi:mRNA interferase MazF